MVWSPTKSISTLLSYFEKKKSMKKPKKMDYTKIFMTIVVVPIVFIFFLVISPPFLLFKFISCTIAFLFPENISGKVVVITGASSGIGEYMAYEYARRGARLVLAARREDSLRRVSIEARRLGSPDVLVVRTDVSKVEHCERLVDETIKHFGQLDHLVNNAGTLEGAMFEDEKVSKFTQMMDINYWGSVYTTQFATPHLKRNKGKIVVISSGSSWFPVAQISIYAGSKGAMISTFETLRVELGSDIGITIVTPGIIESDMTAAGYMNMSKLNMGFAPRASTEGCANAIVAGVCRGDRYVTYPSWVNVAVLFKMVCPEFLEAVCRFVMVTRGARATKKD